MTTIPMLTQMKARIALMLVVMAAELTVTFSTTAQPAIFARSNLVALVHLCRSTRRNAGPKSGPKCSSGSESRRFAYDWRAEHIPTFDAEVEACKRHGIELTAWWFPDIVERAMRRRSSPCSTGTKSETQLWVMGSGEPVRSDAEQRERVEAEAARIRPIAEAAATDRLHGRAVQPRRLVRRAGKPNRDHSARWG